MKTCKRSDIIFIQEPSWLTICSIPSSTNTDGNKLVGVTNHPDWLTFSRSSSDNKDHPCIISYVNVHLLCFHFNLCKDLFNHRDISCLSFFNNEDIYFLFNIYSDDRQPALKYLKNTEVNIQNVLIMTSDFNVRDIIWNNLYLFQSIHSDTIFDIADSFDICLSL